MRAAAIITPTTTATIIPSHSKTRHGFGLVGLNMGIIPQKKKDNNMKKYILLITIFVLSMACSTVDNTVGHPPEQIREFLKAVMENPELMYNVKKNFPGIVLDGFHESRITDDRKIKHFVKICKESFDDKELYKYFSFESALNKRYALLNYQKDSFIMSLEKKDIYFTNLCRDNKGVINIVWFYKDGNYYLYDLLAISDEKIESIVIIEDD